MNKSELLAKMAEKGKLTKVDAKKSIKRIYSTVEETLVKGDKVQLVGFGTFESRERKARSGRNPRNPKEVIEIPASKARYLRPGKSLKEAVNK